MARLQDFVPNSPGRRPEKSLCEVLELPLKMSAVRPGISYHSWRAYHLTQEENSSQYTETINTNYEQNT